LAGFPLGHVGNKLKGFRLAARGCVLAGWKRRLYIEQERFALKCNALDPKVVRRNIPAIDRIATINKDY